MNKAYVGVVISDLHFGAIKPQDLLHQLNKVFIEFIENLAILDFIVITGDVFDSKISLNSEHTKIVVYFMKRLTDICSQKKTKMRIVKGTKSHDNEQLDVLNIFYDRKDVDFKIINTVEEEDLFEDLKVLYLPEEYVENQEEYYKDYFEKSYDMTFGHGLVKEVAFIASKQESEITMSKAPIFKTDQLLSITKGPVYFGHIHTPQVIQDRFYYVGSFARWCFGEEGDKGFYLTSYIPENGEYTAEFIVNKLAKRYDTVRIDENSSIFNETIDNQINKMISIINTLSVDYLRFIVSIPEEYSNPLLLTNMLNEIFSKYSNVKMVINNNSKLRQKKNTEEKINLLLEKYGFIFDKNIPHEEKISKFLKIKYNKNISLDRLREYLYEQIMIKGE